MFVSRCEIKRESPWKPAKVAQKTISAECLGPFEDEGSRGKERALVEPRMGENELPPEGRGI